MVGHDQKGQGRLQHRANGDAENRRWATPKEISPVSAAIVLYSGKDSFAGIAGVGDGETTILPYPSKFIYMPGSHGSGLST